MERPPADPALSLGELLRFCDFIASASNIRDLGITFEVHEDKAVAYLHSTRLVALDSVQVSQGRLLDALDREVGSRSLAFEGQLKAGDAATFHRLEEVATWAPPGYNPKSTCLHLMALAASAGLQATVTHQATAPTPQEISVSRECFVLRYLQNDGKPTGLTSTVWMNGKAETRVDGLRVHSGMASAWPESQSRDFAAGVTVLRSGGGLGPVTDHDDKPMARPGRG
ncbi:MAG: hypothetical protein ACREPQ_00540 [Rhodanobacter sp.]